MKKKFVTFIVSLCFVADTSNAKMAVSTSTVQSSQVAEKILQMGGNAVDAACAASIALGVTQGYFTGIGGSGFLTLHRPGKDAITLDFRGIAPLATTSSWFLGKEGKPIPSWTERNTGGKAVAVPGLVAGCAEAQRKWGRLQWAQIVEPSVRLARDGYEITQTYQEELSERWPTIAHFALTKEIFGGASKTGLKRGEFHKQPLLAMTLEQLSKEGAASFYTGNLAKGWLKGAQELGVPLTYKDLKSFSPTKRKPVEFLWGSGAGVTQPPPSSAALTVGAVLRYLQHAKEKHGVQPVTSFRRWVTLIEASSRMAQVRNERLSDPKRAKLDVYHFYGSSEELKIWNELDQAIDSRLSRVTGSKEKYAPSSARSVQGHTANVSVVDSEGNAAALTSSVDNVMGAGITVPGYGFVLNSALGDFTPDPTNINSPAAGQRPRSNMSPTIIYDQKNKNKRVPIAIVGAAGGPIIPWSIVQFLELYYFHGLSAVDALKFPRVFSADGKKIEIENAAPVEVIEGLVKAGYEVAPTATVWAIFEGIARKNADAPWEAVSDPRYDGLAIAK